MALAIYDAKKDALAANHIIDMMDDFTGHYNKIYPWTNEVLSLYYNYEDLTAKKALCVTASGDHTIHAILAGATYIDSFDVNKLTKYYANLKIAMIRRYELKKFLEQFENNYVKSDINLEELSEFLSESEILFWKNVFQNPKYDNNSLYRKDGYYSDKEENCAYLNEQNYNILKERLRHVKIVYHDLNISTYETDENLSTYDAIFLSNIAEYSGIGVLKCGKKLLNKNGVLYDHHNATRIQEYETVGLTYEKALVTLEEEQCGVSIYRKK